MLPKHYIVAPVAAIAYRENSFDNMNTPGNAVIIKSIGVEKKPLYYQLPSKIFFLLYRPPEILYSFIIYTLFPYYKDTRIEHAKILLGDRKIRCINVYNVILNVCV